MLQNCCQINAPVVPSFMRSSRPNHLPALKRSLGSLAVWCGAVVGVVSVALTGCFNVRQPEPSTAAAEWEPAVQADVLLGNFQRAIQQVNPATYERCFVGPSFQFQPEPTIAARNPGIFDLWRLDQERAYFQRLASRTTAAVSVAERVVHHG
jgi:hypothetical protein